MELKITPSGQTIVKPTALGPGANTDTKLLIYGLFQEGRVLAQDGHGCAAVTTWSRVYQLAPISGRVNRRRTDSQARRSLFPGLRRDRERGP